MQMNFIITSPLIINNWEEPGVCGQTDSQASTDQQSSHKRFNWMPLWNSLRSDRAKQGRSSSREWCAVWGDPHWDWQDSYLKSITRTSRTLTNRLLISQHIVVTKYQFQPREPVWKATAFFQLAKYFYKGFIDSQMKIIKSKWCGLELINLPQMLSSRYPHN